MIKLFLIIIYLKIQFNFIKSVENINLRESSENETNYNIYNTPPPIVVDVLRNEELLWNYEKHNDYYGKFFQFNNEGFNEKYTREFLEDLKNISKESDEYSVQILFRLGYENVLNLFHGNLVLFKLILIDENGLESDIRLCFNILLYSHSNIITYSSKTQQIQNCSNIVMQRRSIADGQWHSFVATISRRHVKILFDCTDSFNILIKDNQNFGILESTNNMEIAKIVIAETNATEYIQFDIKEIRITTEIGQKNNSICDRAKELNFHNSSNQIELHKKFYFEFENRDWDSSKFHRISKSIYANIALPQNSTYASSSFTFECIFRCYQKFEGQMALLSMFDSKDGNNMNFGIISGKSLVWNNLSRSRRTYEVSRGVFSSNILNGYWNHIVIKIRNSGESSKKLQFYSDCHLLGEETLDGSFFFRNTLQQIILFRNISMDKFQKVDVKEMNLYTNIEVDECRIPPQIEYYVTIARVDSVHKTKK